MKSTALIKKFIHSYDCALNKELKKVGEGIYAIELSGSQFIFTLDSDIAAETGVEFLTLGHPLLDQMIAVGSQQGQTANLFVPLGEDKLQRFKSALPMAPPLVDGALPTGLRLVYQPQLVLNFRVALLADIRREELVSIAADPETGEIKEFQIPDGVRMVSPGFQPLPDKRRRPRSKKRSWSELSTHLIQFDWLREIKYPFYRLYKEGCHFLINWISDRYGNFEQEQQARLEQETQRLSKYYDDLMEEEMSNLYELLHKAAVLKVRVSLAKRPDTRTAFEKDLSKVQQEIDHEKKRCTRIFEDLAAEKGRRLHELTTKLVPKASLQLISGAVLYLPRAQVSFLCQTPNYQGRVESVYDFLQEVWLSQTCEVCGERVSYIKLGDQGKIICFRCAQKCEVCQGITDYEVQECWGCGRRMCSACMGNCPENYSLACPYCQDCSEIICKECISLLSSGYEAGI